MEHPFKTGDEVIFYQDTKTDDYFNSCLQMQEFMEERTVLLVVDEYTSIRGYLGIRCIDKETGGHIWVIHPDDLKHVRDPRTQDEIYLDNLLKGAN